MESVKKDLFEALTVDRLSLHLPDDDKRGSWFHQTSLSKHGCELRKPFVWSGRLDNAHLPFKRLLIENVGEVSLPLSNQVFSTLVDTANQSKNNLETLANCANNDCCYLESSKIFIPTRHSEFKRLITQLSKTAFEEALGFSLAGLNLNIDCSFKDLVLCQPGQKVSLFNQQQANPGFLATIILDLPVENGYKGGLLRASQAGFETEFKFERQNTEHFNISIVSQDNTNAAFEPISEGKRVLMVFHVTWREATRLGDWFDSRLVPELLIRARRVRDCLASSWACTAEGYLYYPKNESCTKECTQTGGSPSKAANLGQEVKMERQFFFPLQYHKFMNNLVSYSRLPTEDRFALAVLSLVSFIDANLVIVKTDSDATDKSTADNLNAQVQQWFSSTNEFPPPGDQCKLDVKTQMIGSFQVTLEREPNESVECYDYCYAALIIQPRNESIRLSCRRSFDAVLDHLEQRIPAALEERLVEGRLREQLLFDLRVVLEFCRNEPLKVWCKPAVIDCDLNITKRLWLLCLRLGAREEGLALLKLVSSEIPATPNEDEIELGAIGLRFNNGQVYSFCELIRDHDIARLIADFACNVAGWEACSESILSMITLEGLYGRLFLISYLAQQLHSKGLVNASFNIVEKVSLVLKSVTREQAYGFGPCDTRPFVVLILHLMDSAKPEDRPTFLPFLSYYSNFDPYDLYYMVVGFKWQFDRTIDTCPDLYRELCRLLSSASFETSERLGDIDLVELVKVYQQTGHAANTEALLKNICVCGAKDEPSNTPLLFWSFSMAFGTSSVEMEDIEDGFTILKAISSVSEAREAIVKWMDSRVAEVDDFVDKEKQALPGSLHRRYDYVIKEVTCYFLLMIQSERIPEMGNPKRMEQICANLPKFSTKLLCHLVNVAEMLEEEMVDCPSVQIVFTRLTQEVESRDESEVIRQLGRLDLVRSFVSEGDSMMNERTFATETACSEDDDESDDIGDDCDDEDDNDNSQDESSMAVDADR